MSTRKNELKSICTANVGCVCGKSNLSDVYEPEPKPKQKTTSISTSTLQNKPPNPSCSSSSSISFNTSTQSSEAETDSDPSKRRGSCFKIVDSVAVVKDSDDPHRDFRRSMMQMIMEKEIYSKEDLQELLNCFLDLNSTAHHDVIVRAFTEIWNEVAISRRLELHPQTPRVHGDRSHES